MRTVDAPTTGVRANLGQFLLLIGVNALVGALVGQERTLVPLLGVETFGLRSASAVLAFVVAFGAAKAIANLLTGHFADRIGRRNLLILGWAIGLPVPVIIMIAPSWGWVIAANALLGINQGITWSLTLIMKMDLAGPRHRGLAASANEAAGYGAVAVSAWITGFLADRYGLRPEPLFLGVAFAGLGFILSVIVRDTGGHTATQPSGSAPPSLKRTLLDVSFKDRQLGAVSRTGLVNNATDAVAWGLLPVVFVEYGLDAGRVGTLAALYTGTWAVGQLFSGSASDRIGRRELIAAGMLVQGIAIVGFASFEGFAAWAGLSTVFGLGTALVYPTLLAAVVDLSPPAERARALGVYRLWRDSGYVAGAVAAGLIADSFGSSASIVTVGFLAAAAGLDAMVNLEKRRFV